MRSIVEIVGDNDVANMANLGANRYAVQPVAPTETTRAAFNNLVLDQHCGQCRGVLSDGRHRSTVAAYCKAIGIRFHDGMRRSDDGTVRLWAERERMMASAEDIFARLSECVVNGLAMTETA